jgi:2-hydroxychromene-2-carboxylate isomerase
MNEIDFYFDFYSPYAYLASHRVAEIADKYHCKVNYYPIDIKRAKLAVGNTGPANVDIPKKLRYLTLDLQRWADRYGLPLGRAQHADYSRINKGLFFAKDRGAERDYVRHAYDLVWGQSKDPDSDQVLSGLARSLGWDVAEFLAYVSSKEIGDLYESVFESAIERGVFGVPFVAIGDEAWWGNDRLFLVEEYLSGKPVGANGG